MQQTLKLSRKFKFVMRFGSTFSQISTILLLAGVVFLFRSIRISIHELPTAVVLIIVGSILFSISIFIANGKIELIENGKITLGTFKEWRNSFILRNNDALVYLIYIFNDDRQRKREATALSNCTDAQRTTHILYDGERSIVFEYLPGSPELLDNNHINISSATTILKYIIMLLIALACLVTSIVY